MKSFSYPSSVSEALSRSTGSIERLMLALNELEYLDMPGLSVLLGRDAYHEGDQGVSSWTPGQSQPVRMAGRRRVDRSLQEVSLP